MKLFKTTLVLSLLTTLSGCASMQPAPPVYYMEPPVCCLVAPGYYAPASAYRHPGRRGVYGGQHPRWHGQLQRRR